ncbi:MAG: guanylate kinase [Clostridia bacterium]|nr:guanylate kinase [Clostridia bacterium]
MTTDIMIICGPSGAGKGTVISQLVEDQRLWLSRSVTTRAPSPGEERGVHYDFITMEDFIALRDKNELAEWNIYNNCGYGTPVVPLVSQLENGKTVVLDIDLNGSRQIYERFKDKNVKGVFLVPDSRRDLNARLLNRGDDPADVARRLGHAEREYSEVSGGLPFISAIVNNTLGYPSAAVDIIRRMLRTGVWDECRMDIVKAFSAP